MAATGTQDASTQCSKCLSLHDYFKVFHPEVVKRYESEHPEQSCSCIQVLQENEQLKQTEKKREKYIETALLKIGEYRELYEDTRYDLRKVYEQLKWDTDDIQVIDGFVTKQIVGDLVLKRDILKFKTKKINSKPNTRLTIGKLEMEIQTLEQELKLMNAQVEQERKEQERKEQERQDNLVVEEAKLPDPVTPEKRPNATGDMGPPPPRAPKKLKRTDDFTFSGEFSFGTGFGTGLPDK